MGKIKKLLENELVGGVNATDIYPVTSIKAVFNDNNERLDHTINRNSTVNISTNYNDDHIAEILSLDQAIAKIPSSKRLIGFRGIYLSEDGWHTIIYTGDDISGWMSTDNWIDTPYKIFNGISNNVTFAGITLPSTESEGNLLDPNRIIKNYYIDDKGKIIKNADYSIIYIPMRGNSITTNSNGGGYLAATDEYGNITHVNSETTSTMKTIEYIEGDFYAIVSLYNTYIGKEAAIAYGTEIPSYSKFGYYPITKGEAVEKDVEYLKNRINTGTVDGDNIIDGTIGISKLSDEIIESKISKNLYNPNDPKCVVDYYLGQDGNLKSNSAYIVTGFIPFTESMGSIKCSKNGRDIVGGAFSVLYDKDKQVIKVVQNNTSLGLLTWQENVAYARFSVEAESLTEKIQVEIGEDITEYEPYFRETKIKSNLLDSNGTHSTIAYSSLGEPVLTITKDSLDVGTTFAITEFPYYIKKGLVMSFYANIEGPLTNLYIGKGYSQFRGTYFLITDTSISLIKYEDNESIKEQVNHNITISTYIKISISVDNNGKAHVILQSLENTFEYTFDWGFEGNYAPFILSNDNTLTNIKFSIGCKDFKLPVWAFGDSYFGVDSSRWIGQIKNLGYFNFFVDGLAGASSEKAYEDLQKCLNFGTPKYLIWCLGMNDNDNSFITIFNSVKRICEQKGIILIGATIPTVPTRNKEVISTTVRNSGLRYIDFYKAMGTNSNGEWYTGFLSADGVHPSPLGAINQATQALNDFSEFMQYSNSVVANEINYDNSRSRLNALTVQAAIDELQESIKLLKQSLS